ncbi:hypothetical protein E4T66_06200 [Sinimarinibacterium sp. CAU 1509]|uniref:DUF6691 family protein n=1 Tax=Sinimarinibacterium sp. CAU 1509 TaxID=2562283 RepID=UPI0010AB7ABA|nr:DUF6691 family protein [Sinimarinibacterium sp. CAU 1509]TJY63287.1 hypothetical protein E4T66_06200 [Sinimarinibacterium sp. CAU 1509]
MDMIAPLVKTGVISEAMNLWLAVPIGFIFGLGLYFAGFTDSRRIARAFYLKDVGVPVVMFSAIVTGMIGLWLLSLIGVIDTSKMYFLPTFLMPMAIGGVLFGVGMAIGGFCPGTAAASIATGRVDAMIFVVGFLGGSILFGDLFPVWGDFYNSDYRGVYRLDQLLGLNLGTVVLLLVAASVGGSLLMRFGQHYFWPSPQTEGVAMRRALRYEAPVVVLALAVATVMAFFPTASFLKEAEASWYIIQKADTPAPAATPATEMPATTETAPASAAPVEPARKRAHKGEEGC